MVGESKGADRAAFARGYAVCIMGIDGTWRRNCLLNAISETGAELTVEGAIQGLNLKEFFLRLSLTGLAFRRCELVRVNGAEMSVRFLKSRSKKKFEADLTCSVASQMIRPFECNASIAAGTT